MALASVGAGAAGAVLGREGPSGPVRLAVAILCFWLAGLFLYIAFEGPSVLPSSIDAGGGLKALKSSIEKLFGRASSDVGKASNG